MKLKPKHLFQVRQLSSISIKQQRSLMLLYQPLIGGSAISLYLTLLSWSSADTDWSLLMTHAEFLPVINVGIDKFESDRYGLEAVGLLKTYHKNEDLLEQDELVQMYELQIPFDAVGFFKHPLLSTALLRRVGSESYHLLNNHFKVNKLDNSEYRNISVKFSDYFNTHSKDQSIDDINEQEKQDFQTIIVPNSFDYSRFLKYLIAENVSHTQFSAELKSIVISIHTVYQLNEAQMTELIRQAINLSTQEVDLSKLKMLAENKYGKVKEHNAVNPKKNPNTFPKTYDGNSLKERQTQLAKEFPSLSAQDIQLAILCEQISLRAFLNKLKQSTGGFATDSEQFYVHDLMDKSALIMPVVNMLVYYLLVIKERDNIYKGELERTANQWQKLNIDSSAQAIQKAYELEVQTTQNNKENKNYSNKWQRKDTRRFEELPDWLVKQEQHLTNENQKIETNEAKQTDPLRENKIRDRLNQLFNEGGN